MFERLIKWLDQTDTNKCDPEAEKLNGLLKEFSEDRMVERFLKQCIEAFKKCHINPIEVPYYNYLRIDGLVAEIVFTCDIGTGQITRATCNYGLEKGWDMTSNFTEFKLSNVFIFELKKIIQEKCIYAKFFGDFLGCTKGNELNHTLNLLVGLDKDDKLYGDIFDVARRHIYNDIRNCKRSEIYSERKEYVENLFSEKLFRDLKDVKNYLSTTRLYYDELQICFYSSTESNQIIRVECFTFWKGSIRENIVLENSQNIKVVLTYGFLKAIQERICKKDSIRFFGCLDQREELDLKRSHASDFFGSLGKKSYIYSHTDCFKDNEAIRAAISFKLD